MVFFGISAFPMPAETSWYRRRDLLKGVVSFFKNSEKVEWKVVGWGEQRNLFALSPFKYLASFE